MIDKEAQEIARMWAEIQRKIKEDNFTERWLRAEKLFRQLINNI